VFKLRTNNSCVSFGTKSISLIQVSQRQSPPAKMRDKDSGLVEGSPQGFNKGGSFSVLESQFCLNST
jgi:hypothetical protein